MFMSYLLENYNIDVWDITAVSSWESLSTIKIMLDMMDIRRDQCPPGIYQKIAEKACGYNHIDLACVIIWCYRRSTLDWDKTSNT